MLRRYGGGQYKRNTQYEAYCSVFALNTRGADIIFLGDSITARGRWEEFFPDEKVLNRGIGSDTSEGVLHRLEEVIARNPEKIFLMIGINDLGSKIPQDTIEGNIQKIVDQLTSALPDCEIYLESVLPVETCSLKKIQSLNGAIEMISRDADRCEYIDLYGLFIDETGSLKQEMISADGVHLNGEGYRIWVEAIQDYINS